MRKVTISQLWEEYKTHILIPAKAPSIQVSECKNAFYAGIASLMRELYALGNSDITNDEGGLRFEALGKEVRAYTHFVETEFSND